MKENLYRAIPVAYVAALWITCFQDEDEKTRFGRANLGCI